MRSSGDEGHEADDQGMMRAPIAAGALDISAAPAVAILIIRGPALLMVLLL